MTNRMAPVVSHMLWYKVGAADEPAGSSGLAHVLEHLMFRGTETYEPGEISRIVARNGGEDNAFTSWDYTAYWQNVAADRLELVMGLEADRMENLVLADQEVANERMVVVEERRQRIDNDPSSRLTEQMFAALYQNHPYGRPIIGWEQEIEAIETDVLRDFYEHWYAPNNAVLIVSGDVDVEEVRRLAEETYGQVSARDVPERTRPQEPDFDPAIRITIESPEVQQPLWRRFHPAPSYSTGRGRRGPRPAGAERNPGHRADQPALSRPGDRPRHRGRCRHQLFRQRPRRDAIRVLRHAGAGGRDRRHRGGDRGTRSPALSKRASRPTNWRRPRNGWRSRRPMPATACAAPPTASARR